ncbi:hypothetical protein JCM11641_005121 [Rhodosporidiobolus odoratus]
MRWFRPSPFLPLSCGFLLGVLAARLLCSSTRAGTTSLVSLDDNAHSPTLTFSAIFVLSLPSRLDRRQAMRKLADALQLDLDLVNATGKGEGFVRWTAQEVDRTRTRKLRLMADAQGVSPRQVANLALARSLLPDSPAPFPSLDDHDFLVELEQHQLDGTLSQLSPAPTPIQPSNDPEVEAVLAALPSSSERLATIATWFSHTTLWQRVIDEQLPSVLILEDDVDAEWQVERIWRQIEKKLPKAWDIVYLGDCGGREGENPAYLHPYLHRSTSPICLHAYALSLRGASRLLNLLHSSPWTAFSSPLDLQLSYLIRLGIGQINAFSLDPPLFIQREDDEFSDIRTREEARKWTGVLGESTVERIARKEGRRLKRKEWEEEEFYRFFYGEAKEIR